MIIMIIIIKLLQRHKVVILETLDKLSSLNGFKNKNIETFKMLNC